MRTMVLLAALAYLAIMANSSWLFGDFQSASPEGANAWHGLLGSSPQSIRKISITANGEHFEIVKLEHAWHYQGQHLDEHARESSATLRSMLSRAEPVRTFHPEDLTHVQDQDYGFDETGMHIEIEREQTGVRFGLHFGHATPEGGLYYARKIGDPALYVVSGFLVEQTRELIALLSAMPQHKHHEHQR